MVFPRTTRCVCYAFPCGSRTTLSSVISVLPKVPEVTLPDDTDCFEELEPRPLREAKNTVNDYNLRRFTFLPVESAVAIDMMHMMHNLFDHFVPFLLGKSIDLTEEETAPDVVERLFTHYNMEKKKVLLNDILQQGRVIRNTQFSRFIYQISVLATPLLKVLPVKERT